MKADFATGWTPGADDCGMAYKPGFVKGLQDLGIAPKSLTNHQRAIPQNSATRDVQLASLSTKTGFFASSCIRGLSGFANKNRNDWASRKPQGVVLVRGWHNVLTECSRDTQKAVQVSSEDFGGSSHRVKRWEFRKRYAVLRTNPSPRGKTVEHQQVNDWRVAKRPTD